VHLYGVVGVLDRVLEQVAKDDGQLVGIPVDGRRRLHLELDGRWRQVVVLAHLLDTGCEQRLQHHRLALGLATGVLRTRGREHLIDGLIEPLQVVVHPVEEFPAVLPIRIVAFERVDVEAQRGEGSLHLVGHRVEKCALALVQAHLAHQPQAQPEKPADDQPEGHAAEDEEDPLEGGELAGDGARVAEDEDLPADRQGQRHDGEDDTQRDGEPDGTP
jgi:hypothetical protein